MTHKNLEKEAPRSPHEVLGGFVILARAIDKCRSAIANESGEYHYNCPLDQILFNFKGTDADALKEKVAAGATDDELVSFVNETGKPKTEEEIAAWTTKISAINPYNNEEKKEWFVGECERLGLDPQSTTLFQMLDADDVDYFKNK